jgi:predicted small integral membrane protein
MPSIFLYMIFMTLTILPWYTGMILAMAEFFGMHHVSRFYCLELRVSQHFVSDRHSRYPKQADVH